MRRLVSRQTMRLCGMRMSLKFSTDQPRDFEKIKIETTLSSRLAEIPSLTLETSRKVLNLPENASVAQIVDSYRTHSMR